MYIEWTYVQVEVSVSFVESSTVSFRVLSKLCFVEYFLKSVEYFVGTFFIVVSTNIVVCTPRGRDNWNVQTENLCY